MRVALRFLLLLIPVALVAIGGSLLLMKKLEKRWLLSDLTRRTELLFESTHDYLAENLKSGKMTPVTRLINRMVRDERLAGVLVCAPDGRLLTSSEGTPKEITCDKLPARQLAKEEERIVSISGYTLHEGIFDISEEGQLFGKLVLLHDTSYMTRRHDLTRSYVLILLVSLSLVFFLITLAVHRWSMSIALGKVRELFGTLLSGNPASVQKSLESPELSLLADDISQVIRKIKKTKEAEKQTELSRLYSPARLRNEVDTLFGDSQIFVIANREPYIHNRKGQKVEVLLPASGLVTALEPIVRACSGLWIAHGSGNADRETADKDGKLLVPPEKPEYVLKRIWMNRAEEQGYYYGFSNEGLWPLCHIAHTRPRFEEEDWTQYQNINRRFAKAFLKESAGGKTIALIQDYHFALLPQMIRSENPEAVLSLFWHIPWPNPEAFGICPWKKELLNGMLGADLIGFHTQFHCNNFLDTVDRFLEARVDREQFSVTFGGHTCYVKPFSISVEWPNRHEIPIEDYTRDREALFAELNIPLHVKLGLGVDRIDYTKGLVERLRSVERLLERHPEYVGKFCFVQIGSPSRTHIKRYQDLNSEVQELADRINWRFHHAEVPPIHLLLQHHNAPEIFRFYRAADLCFVSSLHDGMNLVAKEFVSARQDEDGVLLLSTFAGASRELSDALLINPYDISECSEALHRALTMSADERRQRMERLRTLVSERNVYAWAGSFLREINRISQKKITFKEVSAKS
jgi:trehalose 6-phosphate synthase